MSQAPIRPTELREAFFRRMDELIQEAAAARQRARSYRDFHVGCAVLAFDPQARNADEAFLRFTGANSKSSPVAKKVCAEAEALQHLAGPHRLAGLVVVGVPQIDERSGVGSPTLHPCGDCRELLSNQRGDPREIQVLTVNALDFRVRELLTVEELLAMHRRDRDRAPDTRNP